MSNTDGRVIINIDSNAQKAAQDFNALDRAVKKTDTDTKAFSGSANVLKNALGAISVGYVTSQLVNLGKSAVNTSMDFQALTNRMNAAAGNKSIGAFWFSLNLKYVIIGYTKLNKWYIIKK